MGFGARSQELVPRPEGIEPGPRGRGVGMVHQISKSTDLSDHWHVGRVRPKVKGCRGGRGLGSSQ